MCKPGKTDKDFITFLERYGKTVKSSKDARSQSIKTFFRQADELEAVLNSFNGESKMPINFNNLASFKLNEDVHLNEKVIIRLVFKSIDNLVFETKMLKHGNFGWHVHNDCTEIAQIKSGCIYDTISDKTFRENDHAIFKPKQEHTPVALEDSFLIVEFVRNEEI